MGMVRVRVVVEVILFLVAVMVPLHVQGIDVPKLRLVAAKNNVTCVYVFGDSGVDPGNNNHLSTVHKGNFPPYGKDFLNGQPTGRFTNGRLATDFIAEALGYIKVIRAYLDPNIEKADLLHGVSFASGGSGYDDLTSNLNNVLSLPHQLQYFKHYKIQLARLVGKKEAEKIVTNALYILSMGTNDFLQNYFIEPTRSQQFTVEQYQNYLVSSMFRIVKAMHSLGARRLAVVGLEPFGCFPLVKTLKDTINCDETYNKVAFTFNAKLKQKLSTLKALLGMRTAFVDIYNVTQTAIQNPKLFGFTETSKGCVGTGTIEFGITCRGLSTCADRTKYLFWDAVHPTEEMHKIIADEASKMINNI